MRLKLGAPTEYLIKGWITAQDFEQRVMRLPGSTPANRPEERSGETERQPVGRSKVAAAGSSNPESTM